MDRENSIAHALALEWTDLLFVPKEKACAFVHTAP